MMEHQQRQCPACHGTGMKAVDENWKRTCKHCFGSGQAAPIFDRSGPHAIDHLAYADGVSRPVAMLALEAEDPFWKTLGGDPVDPWGDQGETMRQRAKALELGLGRAIYEPMQVKR